MNKLYPNAVARRVWQITPQLLNSWGVKGLILDIDNTLTTHNNPIPEPQVAQWLEDNRRAGIRMIVLSNNHPERVRPFALLELAKQDSIIHSILEGKTIVKEIVVPGKLVNIVAK